MTTNLPTKEELEEINELSCAIGHVVLQWGFVELNLNLCLGMIYSIYGGNKIAKKPKIEKFLRRQVDFLRNCFKALDSLIPFKDEGISLLNRVANLVNERDAIIHSTYAGLYKGSFDFAKIDLTNPEMLQIKEIRRTINSILETGKKIQDLAKDLAHFGFRLAGK